MKKTLMMIIATTLFSTATNADLGNLSGRIANQANTLERTTNDFVDGLSRRRAVRQELNELKRLVEKMDNRLRNYRRTPVGNITGSCTLDVGGNLFDPKSKIECTVYGQGAVGYEVRVKSTYRNSIKWQGELVRREARQTFLTSKQKVGGHSSRYEIFVIHNNGQKILIDTLGNRNQ
ncbi:hypothetical protein A9Q84_16830 [Halobacteriovorax marinus]|uniref:Secreted protein n=1 Tax=Halobacteriovorax marinus TaxID=97084 RepID=A0A1Y5F4L3_9BACT|nr:hypothetical protein A9Q84_16830 [Halobacteriovorax marinus]